MTWAQTHTGKAFDFTDMLEGRPVPIVADDIIVSLARQPRYNGHQRSIGHYSIAEHSILVHRRVLELNGSTEAGRWAPLHDAHETITGDIIRPIKLLPIPGWGKIGDALRIYEDMIDRCIMNAFGVYPTAEDLDLVNRADLEVLAFELEHVMGDCDREWEGLPDPPPWPDVVVQWLEYDHAAAAFEHLLINTGVIQWGQNVDVRWATANIEQENQHAKTQTK